MRLAQRDAAVQADLCKGVVDRARPVVENGHYRMIVYGIACGRERFGGGRMISAHQRHETVVVDRACAARLWSDLQDRSRTGLQRLVLLSSVGAHLPAGTGPVLGLHRAESILVDAAPHVTFLRPASFMDNWHGLAGAARGGVLPSFFADLDTPRRPSRRAISALMLPRCCSKARRPACK